MIRKILVYENALATEHPALARALQLARHKTLMMKIVDVIDAPSDTHGELHRQTQGLIEQERKDRLRSICGPLQDQDVDVSTELLRGRPFVEIMREVVHERFHLVIKTAAGAPSTEAMGIMGPVDLRLVRNCPCPVWLEVPGRDVRCERILVAIDPQAEDDDLNKVLLEMGASLAEAAGSEWNVVSAWQVLDEDFLAGKMNRERLASYADDIRSFARQCLDALLPPAGTPGGPNGVRFRKGDPANCILDQVESYRPDVLLMGTVNRTNVSGLLIGNTAETVLRQISCSVLTVKPNSLFRA